MKKKRFCSKCHAPIQRTHRWRTVHHKISIFGFVLLRWDTFEHRDCIQPLTNPKRKCATRIPGEMPLPFPVTIADDRPDVPNEYAPSLEPAP